jgi:hypothetical protein
MKRVMCLAAVVLMMAAGCKARKDYPEPTIGSHSPNFDVVFGRLAAVASSDPEQPIWVVRFGTRADLYQGELALVPAGRPTGFSGGEPIEVRGHVLPVAASAPSGDAFNGRRYAVDSIRLWAGYRE